MRALCASIITAGAMIGLGLVSLGIGIRYQNLATTTIEGQSLYYLRWNQLDTPIMLILVILLAALISGIAATFLGLAYHHERRHYERTRGIGEVTSGYRKD
jgi:hypothetical protein